MNNTWWDTFHDKHYKFFRWFNIWWWKYIFEKRTDYQKGYEISFTKIIFCRIKNHPHGQIFYNSGGYEPDNHCVDCGDEI